MILMISSFKKGTDRLFPYTGVKSKEANDLKRGELVVLLRTR